MRSTLRAVTVVDSCHHFRREHDVPKKYAYLLSDNSRSILPRNRDGNQTDDSHRSPAHQPTLFPKQLSTISEIVLSIVLFFKTVIEPESKNFYPMKFV